MRRLWNTGKEVYEDGVKVGGQRVDVFVYGLQVGRLSVYGLPPGGGRRPTTNTYGKFMGDSLDDDTNGFTDTSKLINLIEAPYGRLGLLCAHAARQPREGGQHRGELRAGTVPDLEFTGLGHNCQVGPAV